MSQNTSIGNIYIKYYKQEAAETTQLDIQFYKIFDGDLIEHLINPGVCWTWKLW